MIDTPVMWAVFFTIIIVMFVLDLFVLNRGAKHISVKRALGMTAFWVSLALSFGVLIYSQMGSGAATEYITAYVIEEMLSVDNLFVFIVVMSYFCVPDEYQHKALFYGIIGAFAFRATFIFLGIELLSAFDWMMYIFGAVLIYAAIKTVMQKDEDEQESKLAVRLSKRFKVLPTYDGDKLFSVRNGVRMMTPLLLCIIVIELTDVMFAFDSIPAVLSITTNQFIAYTSNMFAVLGLRSLYFAIKGTMEHLEYLKYGLGVILAFVGVKMLISNYYHVDVLLSLAVVLIVLTVTIGISLYIRKRKEKAAPLAE
jgi:tellurite resistance protein TerC